MHTGDPAQAYLFDTSVPTLAVTTALKVHFEKCSVTQDAPLQIKPQIHPWMKLHRWSTAKTKAFIRCQPPIAWI